MLVPRSLRRVAEHRRKDGERKIDASRIVYVLVGAAGVYLALTVLPSMFRYSTERSRREHIAQT